LRRDAAAALHRMFDAMRTDGLEGHVQSAFRGFGTQCWLFAAMAQQARHGFCEATEQSALPGHSQHQLGTTLDMFTKEWADLGAKIGEGVFRNGFGCSRGGQWLDDNAWRFGFVVSYPIHPDDRQDGSRCAVRSDRPGAINPKTGYKSEPWHLRFIGVDAAARFRNAWQASGPGTPDEITLEQWLRGGLAGDADLPVCDGCQCGACATLAAEEPRTPCGKAALWLDADGNVVSPTEEPHLIDVRVTLTSDDALVLDILVHAPAHTPTQPPILSATGPFFTLGATFLALRPGPSARAHRYPELKGAWRIAIEPIPRESMRWPWRASLASADLATTWNRANVVLPAQAGDVAVRMRVEAPRFQRARVALLRDGEEHDVREETIR
jgi:D-alanyl-D-alanine carboxypeptidase